MHTYAGSKILLLVVSTTATGLPVRLGVFGVAWIVVVQNNNNPNNTKHS